MTIDNRFAVDFDSLGSEIATNEEDRAPAKAPVASPKARWLAILFGLLLIAVAVVIGRDLLIRADHLSGDTWLPPVFDWFGSFDRKQFALATAIISGGIALLLLIAVVAPRRRTHMELDPLWLRPVDVARLATSTTRGVAGVVAANSVATRKKLTVTVIPARGSGTADLETLKQSIVQALHERLGGLIDEGGVALKVRINNEPGAQA